MEKTTKIIKHDGVVANEISSDQLAMINRIKTAKSNKQKLRFTVFEMLNILIDGKPSNETIDEFSEHLNGVLANDLIAISLMGTDSIRKFVSSLGGEEKASD